MGVAVFFGMLGVTFFGLFLTPVFYVCCGRWRSASRVPRRSTTMSEIADGGIAQILATLFAAAAPGLVRAAFPAPPLPPLGFRGAFTMSRASPGG